MGEAFGGEWIHVYVWLSPFTVDLKPSQYCLLTGYTPTQNKMYKTRNRKHATKYLWEILEKVSWLPFKNLKIDITIWNLKETK